MSPSGTNPWEPQGERGTDWADDPWTFGNADAKLIGDKVWQNFDTVYKNKEESSYIKLASDKWGVPANRWRVSLYPELKVYSSVYGYVHIAAKKKEMRSEFLHAVVFGEGLERFIAEQKEFGLPHQLDTKINSYVFLGLDFIGQRIGMLIQNGFLEERFRNKISEVDSMKGFKNELKEQTSAGMIHGFEAAVEMVAAELKYAGKQMLDKAKEQGIDNITKIQEEFMMYAKYVSKRNALNDLTSKEALEKNCSKWDLETDGQWPDAKDIYHPQYYRFQALKRIATADWYESAKIYAL